MSFSHRSLMPALRLAARHQSAAFHSTPLAAVQASKLVKKPAAAASYIIGTVNDPTTFPPPDKAHGAYHWSFERFLSAALIPLVGATAVTSVNPVLDGVLSVALVVHSHLGFDCIFTDYLPHRKFPIIGPAAMWILRFATGGVLVGVYQFNTNDIGLTELTKRIWRA